MKKICLVTYYGNNYGGCLQAYATQKYLKKMGYEVEILQYENKFSPSKYKILWNKIKNASHIRRYLRQRKIIHSNYANEEIRSKAFENFRKKYLELSDKEYMYLSDEKSEFDKYDVIIAGSDQIWNPTFYGCCHPVYYLAVVPDDKRKISYASSIGLSQIPKRYQADFRKYLQRFDRISVREKVGVKLVGEIAKREAKWVLDPTLLLTKDEWLDLSSQIQVTEEYVFCYLFNDFEYVEEIKQWIRKNFGLKIVSLPFSTREMESLDEKIYDASPADFIRLIKNAKFVLTDSFHATAFSINFNVPFFVLERQKVSYASNMNSRIYSILEMTALQEQMINEQNYKTKLCILNLDFNTANQMLYNKRKEAADFLKEAIEG